MAQLLDLSDVDLSEPVRQDAKAKALGDLTANPDQAAEAYQLGRKKGLPGSAVLLDLDGFKFEDKTDGTSRLIDQTPPLAQYLSKNPGAAQVSNDDYENLAKIYRDHRPLNPLVGAPLGMKAPTEDELGGPAEPGLARWESFNRGWTQAQLSAKRGKLGQVLMADPSDKMKWQQVDEIDRQMAGLTDDNSWAEWTGKMFSGLAQGGWESLASGAVGAGVGAAAGASAAGVGALPGAAAGFTFGAARGYFTAQAAEAAGNGYLNLTKQGVGPVAARLGGLGLGMINYFMNKVALDTASKGVLESIASEGLQKVLTNPGVARAVTNGMIELGKAGLTGAALGAAAEMGNVIVENLAKTVSDPELKSVLNSDSERAAAVARVKHAAADMALMLSFMHVPKVGVNMVTDGLYMRRAYQQQEQFKNLMDSILLSKTRERDPEMFKKYVQELDGQDVGISPEGVLMAGPQNFTWVPDFESKFARAMELGEDVKVSSALMLTHGPDVLQATPELYDHLRLGEGLTVAEAQKLKENPPDYLGAHNPEELRALGSWMNKATREIVPEEEVPAIVKGENVTVEGLQEQVAALTGKELTDVEQARLTELQNGIAWLGNHELRTGEPAPTVEPMPAAEIKADPAAKETFDRTLAVAGQLFEAEQRASWLRDLFAESKAVGMTAAEFRRYLKNIDKRDRLLYDKAFAKAEKEAKKQLTPEWKSAFEAMRSEVEFDFSGQPVHMADRLLRLQELPDGLGDLGGTKVRLDRKAVEEMLKGEAEVVELPKNYFGAKGLDPDNLAAMVGYSSGKQMLLDLMDLQRRRAESGLSPDKFYDQQVRQETQARMEAKFGTLDAKIQEWAEEAVKNRPQLEVLTQEVETLKRMAGIEGPIKKGDLDLAVRDLLNNNTIERSRNVTEFERLAQKFGREAEIGRNNGDWLAAFQAKQNQYIHFLASREARQLDRQAQALEKTFGRLEDNLTLPGVAQPFVDHLQQMIQTVFGRKTFRDPTELARQLDGQPLWDFVQKINEDGRQLDMPSFLTDGKWLLESPHDIGKLRTDDFLALKDFVDQMLFYGRHDGKIEVAGKAWELKDAVGQAKLQMSALPQKGVPDRGWVVSKLQIVDAQLLRMERLIDWLDHRDPNGIFNKFFRGLSDSQNRSQTLRAEVAQRLKDLPKFDGKQLAIGGEEFKDHNGRSIDWDMNKILAATLNRGNASNWEKLIRGYGWDPNKFAAFLDRNLARQPDLVKVAQGIWDTFEYLFPMADEVSRRTNGVGLKKVEALPFLAGQKEIAGGYYPLIEDASAALNKSKTVADEDFTEKFFGGALPTRGYEKTRTNAIYPISLDIDRLPSRLNQMIHNIAFHENWVAAKKFFSQKEVRQGISDTFGEEYTRMIDPWLEHIRSNGGMNDPQAAGQVANWLRLGRENAVTVLIGAKLGTAAIHGTSAAINSVREAGGTDFAKATYQMLFATPQSFDKYSDLVRSKSEMMLNRKHNIDRDIANILNGIDLNSKWGRWRAAYAQFMTSWVATLDMASTYPTWLAVYNKALAEHGDEGAAVYTADKAVRNAHGGSGLVDLPAFMRGSGTDAEIKKFTTMFGGYFNHVYNQMRDTGRMATEIRNSATIKEGFGKFMSVMGGLMAYAILPGLAHEFLRPPPGGHDADHLGADLAWAVANQFGSMIPVVRDIAAAGHLHKKIEMGSPFSEVLEGLYRPFADIYTVAKGGKAPAQMPRHLIEASTWFTGVGSPRTITDMATYLYKLTNGTARPPTTYTDWQRLILDSREPSTRRNRR